MSFTIPSWRRRMVIVAAVSVISVPITHGQSTGNGVIDEVISRQADRIATLSSIEYNSSIQSENESPIRQTFIYDQGMYRSSLSSLDSRKPFQKEVAFDGRLYQELDAGQSTLSVTRNRPKAPYLVMEILTLSYAYAIPPVSGYDFSINTLRDNLLWQEVASKATFKGYRRVFENKCAVLSIEWPTPDGPVIYEVAFAEGFDWYPIYMEASDCTGRTACKMEISPWSVEDAVGKSICVPQAVKLTKYRQDGSVFGKTVLEAEKNSFRINHSVPIEVFTIPRTQADIFVDVDLRASTYTRLDSLEDVNNLGLQNDEPGSSTKPATASQCYRPGKTGDQSSASKQGSARSVQRKNTFTRWGSNWHWHVAGVILLAIVASCVYLLLKRYGDIWLNRE